MRRGLKKGQSLKSPTYVIMQMLAMSPDAPDTEESKQPLPQTVSKWTDVDVLNAEIMDKAYSSDLLPSLSKEIIRLYYFQNRSPKVIEQRLQLGRFTFKYHKECAISDFAKLCDRLKKEN